MMRPSTTHRATGSGGPRWPTVAVAGMLLLLPLGCRDAPRAGASEVAVEVALVALDRDGAPMVLLEEQGGGRSLPIWIGFAEAHSIASEIEHRRPPRPNTHDLAKALLERLHGAVRRVVVTELRDGTYYAVVVLDARGERVEVDARPSDAIALALRFGAPVFVRETLFGAVEREPPPPARGRST